ncbi:MAG: mechanosensitive ion channel family protein [Hungatella sp.]|jgi:small conductance mechanosensitive channel|nr:mechanosensitive ion channel family protein [Hungatella sp.]
MIIWHEAQTTEETLELAQEVYQDLEQLRPNMVFDTLKSWLPGLTRLGYRILMAALILLIGFRVAGMVRKMLEKSFTRMEMEISLKKFLLSMVYAMVCGLSIFIAADKLGISSASIIAILGSAGLAISLSMQNMLGNFAGGVIILLMKPFKVGDYIICGQEEGTVAAIGLVYTTLNTMDNKQIVLPNGNLSNTSLTNVTAQEKRRLELKVGISYQSDLKKAKDILYGLFEAHPLIKKDQDLIVFVDQLGESSVVIGARGWVETGNYWSVKWELTEKVKLAFDEAGIEIPFRQMDVNVKSKG